MVLCPLLVQFWCSSGPRARVVKEACWVYVYKPILDFEEHPQAGLLSLLFKT